MKLKTYTLGNSGFIHNDTADLLGIPRHVRQARVYVVASSKAEAVRILNERGFYISLSDPEFRMVVGGRDYDALTSAGVLDEPGVWATDMLSRDGDAVIHIQPGGVPVRIGHLERAKGYEYTFVSEDEGS